MTANSNFLSHVDPDWTILSNLRYKRFTQNNSKPFLRIAFIPRILQSALYFLHSLPPCFVETGRRPFVAG